MKYVKPTLIASLSFALALCALSGCNTVEGAGEDVEIVGDEMQEVAN